MTGNNEGSFRENIVIMKRHQEALTISLKLKSIQWSSVLLYEFSLSGQKKLQRRLDVLEENQYKLREYIEGYQSHSDPERKHYAMAMLRQYDKYIALLHESLDDLTGLLQRAQSRGEQLGLFDSYPFEPGKIDD